MKFNFLNFKKDKTPALKSLKPRIFNVNLFWFASLTTFFLIFVITAVVGLDLFYCQYSDEGSESVTENFEEAVNIKGLENAVDKRGAAINAETKLPRDPSL